MDTSRVGSNYRKMAKSKEGVPGKAKKAEAKPKASPKTKTSSSEVEGRGYRNRSERAEAATPKITKPSAKVYSNRDAAPKPKKPDVKMPKVDTSRVKANFGSGDSKEVMHKGKNMANVTADQLKKTGMSLREYMNEWGKTGKRPT